MEIRDIYKLDTRFRKKKTKEEREFNKNYQGRKGQQASFNMESWGVDLPFEKEFEIKNYYYSGK